MMCRVFDVSSAGYTLGSSSPSQDAGVLWAGAVAAESRRAWYPIGAGVFTEAEVQNHHGFRAWSARGGQSPEPGLSPRQAPNAA